MTFKNIYLYTNLFILIIGGGLLGYWYFLDGVWNPVIDIKSDPMAMELVQDHYHRGDIVYAYYSFCKLRDIPVVTNWRLVDGEIILLAPTVRQTSLGCHGIDKPYQLELIRLPMTMEPGIWHLEAEASFKLNPVKTIHFTRKTLEFEVLP